MQNIRHIRQHYITDDNSARYSHGTATYDTSSSSGIQYQQTKEEQIKYADGNDGPAPFSKTFE